MWCITEGPKFVSPKSRMVLSMKEYDNLRKFNRQFDVISARAALSKGWKK